MSDNMFLKKVFMGSDGDDFRSDFIDYLEDVLATSRWDAMSDHQLYLDGARRAITEIINELKLLEAKDARS